MSEIVFWAWFTGMPIALAIQFIRLYKTKTELKDLEDEFRLFKMKTNLEMDDEEESSLYVEDSLSEDISTLDKDLTWLKMEVHNADMKIQDALAFQEKATVLLDALSKSLQEHKEQNTSYHISIGKKVSDIIGEIEKLKQVPSK